MSPELINSRNGAKGYDLNLNLNTGTHLNPGAGTGRRCTCRRS